MTDLTAEDILNYLDGELTPEAHARMTSALLTEPEPAAFVLEFVSSIEIDGTAGRPIDTVEARLQLLNA